MRVSVSNGFEDPHEVPILDDMPECWYGIEQAYGEGKKLQGQAYVRWYSSDAKHKSISGAKLVMQFYCEEQGIQWMPMYDEFTRLQNEEADRKAAERAKISEDRGKPQERNAKTWLQCAEDISGNLAARWVRSSLAGSAVGTT